MKKIISLIFVSILAFSSLCITSFASSSTVNFDDYFEPTNIIIAPLNEDTVDVEKFYDPEYHIYTAIPARDDEVLYYWGSHVRVDFIPQGFSAGTRLIFNMKVDIYLDERVKNTEYVYPKLMVNDNGKWVKAGTWKAIQEWTPADRTITMLYMVDYVFKEDVSVVQFTFDQASVNHTLSVFNRVSYDFPEKVNNFYLGPNDDPSLPNYVDPNDTLGNDTNDLKEKEEALMNETEQGRADTLSLFSGLGNLITELSVPLMAISALFNYFIGNSILNSVLQISLTLGLLGFVFNLGQSLLSRSNNQRGNKQKNKKGGG